MFPFRSQLQKRLRAERMRVDAATFAQELGMDERNPELSRALWEILREESFVPDFRPKADDSLPKIYSLGPEEVRDDLIEPLLDRLGLNVAGIDFRAVDFTSVVTPKDVGNLVMRIAAIGATPDSRGRDNPR